jgi:hypothetical protein
VTTRFRIRDELKSSSGYGRMKPYIPDWPVMLDGLRDMWEIGEETILETPFFEWFNKPKKML